MSDDVDHEIKGHAAVLGQSAQGHLYHAHKAPADLTAVKSERDSLLERVRVLEESLRPFAETYSTCVRMRTHIERFDDDDSFFDNFELYAPDIHVGHLRTAASVLGEE